MGRDENGQGAIGGLTWELMRGADVRVLIPPTRTTEQALILLRKNTDWVKRGGLDSLVRTAQNGSRRVELPDTDDLPF